LLNFTITPSHSSLPLISSYLRKEFLRFFALNFILFVFLATLVDFFDRLDYLVKYKAAFSTVLLYFAFKIPLLIIQVAPIAALVATLLGLGLLSRNQEIIALKACGVSHWQITKPFIFVGGIISLGLWGWNETVVPYAYRHSRYINLQIKNRTPKSVFRENGFWYHGRNTFYHIEHFDSRNNILSGLTIYTIDEHFQVLSLVEVSKASWQNGKWHFQDFHSKSLAFSKEQDAEQEKNIILKETPEDFSLVDMEPDEFSSRQLQDYIDNLRGKGVDTTAYQVDLRLKKAIPVAVFSMIFLGVALAIPGAKQRSVPTAVGFALMGGFGYWLLLAFTVSLGHGGVLPPLFAAWSANGVSILLSIYFLLGLD